MTPEYNVEEQETSCQQFFYDNEIIETPQMKAIRAKALQRLSTRNKSSPSSSDSSYARTVEDKKKEKNFSRRNSSLKLRNDKSVTSQDKNDNKVTFTSQMRVLYEKIEQRISNESNTSKTPKEDAKNKQQGLNTTNQKSMKKIGEKQEKNTGYREDNVRNKGYIEQRKNQNTQKLYQQNVSSKYNCIYIYI